jgi:tetratricopeptide (TPR) repeat protein
MRISRRESIAIVVALLAFFAFLPALRNGFVWDDELNFLGNPYYRGLGWAQLRWMFTTAYLGPYQPLSWLSSGLDFVLWGMSPIGYHAGNLLLHAANAVLVYFLALRLLPLAAPGDVGERKTGLFLCAGAAALLFAVHPLRVEAVAWATERRSALAGFFYLSAIWCYLEADLNRGVAAGLFLLSLLSKGIGVALPITLLALDVYPLRRLPADMRRWFEPEPKAVLREKAPFFLLAVVFGVVEIVAYSRFPVAGPEAYSPVLRAARACYALVFYALKTVAPFRLSPSYGLPTELALLVCAAAVLSVTWGLYRARERWPFGLPVWAHYVATLLPVLGLFKFGEHLVADRYSYLACVAWPILAAGGLWSLGRREAASERRVFRGALAATAVVLIGLGLLSWMQAGIWRSSVSLWRHALVSEPDSAFVRKQLGNSYYNLGNAFLQRGRSREAWRLYYEAARLDPANAMTRNNLGILLLRNGAPGEAAARFREALVLDPGLAIAHNGLGLALVNKGDLKEGAASFCRALRLNPALAGVEANLRAVLAKNPRLSKGLDDDCRQRFTTRE